MFRDRSIRLELPVPRTIPTLSPNGEPPAGSARSVRVSELFEARRGALDLECLTPDVSLERAITDPDLSSPGLALAGFTRRVPAGRVQVFGETEILYLHSLPDERRQDHLNALLERGIPCVVVSKGLQVPEVLLERARAHGTPVLRSPHSTRLVYRRLKPFLEEALAPTLHLHGSLADVYGVGLLFIGESGIGKSECVLDLVERGHRLVADDLVIATRRGNDILIGRGHELQRHHMEIRGIGIIDVRALFGVRAIRQQKRIEVVVELERWSSEGNWARSGLDREEVDILGVRIPRVRVPLNPGKNITVISEVVAMDHLLKYAGIDSAAAFNQRLIDSMAPVRAYLEEDDE